MTNSCKTISETAYAILNYNFDRRKRVLLIVYNNDAWQRAVDECCWWIVVLQIFEQFWIHLTSKYILGCFHVEHAAKTLEQLSDAFYWTLLAYCHHGVECITTFTDAQHLNGMCPEDLERLILSFIMAQAKERRTMGIIACPRHVRKKCLLEVARR